MTLPIALGGTSPDAYIRLDGLFFVAHMARLGYLPTPGKMIRAMYRAPKAAA
jgi:hypothetical protein